MCRANGALRPETAGPLAALLLKNTRAGMCVGLNLTSGRQGLLISWLLVPGLRHEPRGRRGRRLREGLSAVVGNQTNIACHYAGLWVASWESWGCAVMLPTS